VGCSQHLHTLIARLTLDYRVPGAAAHFEAGDYDAAIKTEEEAVEQGRELRADFKLVAKYVLIDYS
jgi:hypothetical protein